MHNAIMLMSDLGIDYIISLTESAVKIVVRFKQYLRCNVQLFLLSIFCNCICSENVVV